MKKTTSGQSILDYSVDSVNIVCFLAKIVHKCIVSITAKEILLK